MTASFVFGSMPHQGPCGTWTKEDLREAKRALREAWLAATAEHAEAPPRPGRGPRRDPGHGQWGPWGPQLWGLWGSPGDQRRRGGPGDPRRGWGGRGRASRGDVRLAILALLVDGPRHGYQLIQDIAERSSGAWSPSPGSIYPALSALQDEGLIDDEKIDGRKVFSLTEAGRQYAQERADDLARVFADNTAEPEHEDLTDLRELIWGVGGAALTVLGSGTEQQREAARDILKAARRDLYRILSEEDEDDPDGSEQ